MTHLCSNQHQQNFNQFYIEHYHWLSGWLKKTLHSQQHAEDILQDTFLKIFIAPEVLQRIKAPRPFLATTAKHIVISQARRKKIEQAYLHHLEQHAEDCFELSPETQLLMIETLYRMSMALSGLEQRSRQIMMWHYLEGISQVDIAKKLDISVKTIRSDLIKAVVYCHRYLQSDRH